MLMRKRKKKKERKKESNRDLWDLVCASLTPPLGFLWLLNRYFQFVGRVLGLALLHHHFIEHAFTRTFYKSMLGMPVTLRCQFFP
jgi:hypothetical protein